MGFDEQQRKLSIRVDFEVGSRFAVPGQIGEHPVHDTVTKTYRHLNFFQYQCDLEVRVPRVKLPHGKVVQVSPPWAGKLSGFSLLFEAFVLLLSRQMPFSGVSRVTGESIHRVMAVCHRYVEATVAYVRHLQRLHDCTEHGPQQRLGARHLCRGCLWGERHAHRQTGIRGAERLSRDPSADPAPKRAGSAPLSASGLAGSAGGSGEPDRPAARGNRSAGLIGVGFFYIGGDSLAPHAA